MDRMEHKHARQVQIALDKERVQLEGAVRVQTRLARQVSAELVEVQGEQIQLREQLHLAAKDNHDMVKTIGRERRQHNVDRNTLYACPLPYTSP
jgi:hypothetical protein